MSSSAAAAKDGGGATNSIEEMVSVRVKQFLSSVRVYMSRDVEYHADIDTTQDTVLIDKWKLVCADLAALSRWMLDIAATIESNRQRLERLKTQRSCAVVAKATAKESKAADKAVRRAEKILAAAQAAQAAAAAKQASALKAQQEAERASEAAAVCKGQSSAAAAAATAAAAAAAAAVTKGTLSTPGEGVGIGSASSTLASAPLAAPAPASAPLAPAPAPALAASTPAPASAPAPISGVQTRGRSAKDMSPAILGAPLPPLPPPPRNRLKPAQPAVAFVADVGATAMDVTSGGSSSKEAVQTIPHQAVLEPDPDGLSDPTEAASGSGSASASASDDEEEDDHRQPGSVISAHAAAQVAGQQAASSSVVASGSRRRTADDVGLVNHHDAARPSKKPRLELDQRRQRQQHDRGDLDSGSESDPLDDLPAKPVLKGIPLSSIKPASFSKNEKLRKQMRGGGTFVSLGLSEDLLS